MAHTICVDGLFLGQQYLGCGINRYCVNLLRYWEQLTAGTSIRTQVLVESARVAEHYGWTGRPGFDFIRCSALRSRRRWNRIWVVEAARRLKAELLFMPSPEHIYFKRMKLAVTIHDLIPLVFSQEAKGRQWDLLRAGYLSCLHRADLILTDSEWSKRDMVERFGVPSNRIVIAYLGFDSRMFNTLQPGTPPDQDLLRRYGIDRPYLLHVGSWQPRKNLHRLIRAFRLWEQRARDSSLQLVLCGVRAPRIDRLDELIQELSLDGRVIMTGRVADSELVKLYQQALGFAMPSLYEGFGLPPLEAMACGVPVMSSNRSSLPEVLSDAALYFDPESEDEIASAIEKLCSDSALRTRLVSSGLGRVKQFSWEACARATLAAIQEA
jgi:glycosyltransferase involved in cell wall biosynthesis